MARRSLKAPRAIRSPRRQPARVRRRSCTLLPSPFATVIDRSGARGPSTARRSKALADPLRRSALRQAVMSRTVTAWNCARNVSVLPRNCPHDNRGETPRAFHRRQVLANNAPGREGYGGHDLQGRLRGVGRIGHLLMPDGETQRHILVAHSGGSADDGADRPEERDRARHDLGGEPQPHGGQEVADLVTAGRPGVTEAGAVEPAVAREAGVAEGQRRLQSGDGLTPGSLENSAQTAGYRPVVHETVVLEEQRQRLQIGRSPRRELADTRLVTRPLRLSPRFHARDSEIPLLIVVLLYCVATDDLIVVLLPASAGSAGLPPRVCRRAG